MTDYRSWGHLPAVRQAASVPHWAAEGEALVREPPASGNSRLPFGRGRSYGDSCLNSTGELIDTRAPRSLRRVSIASRGVLTAEPGVTLAEILALIVPAGLVPAGPPPGTSHATPRGCDRQTMCTARTTIAMGTFGRFVHDLQLVRSSGESLTCSLETNPQLFAATIGGLGADRADHPRHHPADSDCQQRPRCASPDVFAGWMNS